MNVETVPPTFEDGRKRPSGESTSTSDFDRGRGSDSDMLITPRASLSVGALLNDDGDGDRGDQNKKDKEDEAKDDEVVKFLSLHTQASHATIRPTPLETIGGPSKFRLHNQPRINIPVNNRKRGRNEDDDDEIEYQGITPSTWNNWEKAGGVKGSGYCYAYDNNGESYRPELSFVFMLRLVIAASPRKRLSLSSIYQAIEERWPYFKQNQGELSWKNSVRHCLSYNPAFINIDRSSIDKHDKRVKGGEAEDVDPSTTGRQGRGGFWTLADSINDMTRSPRRRPTLSRSSPPSTSAQVQEGSGLGLHSGSGSGSFWRLGSTQHARRIMDTNTNTDTNTNDVSEHVHLPPIRYHHDFDIPPRLNSPPSPRSQSQSQSQSVINPRSHLYPHHTQTNYHVRSTTTKSRILTSSTSSESDYKSNGSSGSISTPTDPLGLIMSRALLAEIPIGVERLEVDIVSPELC